jgi:hypothetical protein
MASILDNQLSNRSFLYPQAFKFLVSKIPTVSFYASSANIPEINYTPLEFPTRFKNIPIENTVAEFGNLDLEFMVDEDMQNYMAIFNWIEGLAFPDNHLQYRDLVTDEDGNRNNLLSKSDASLVIYNNNYNPNIIIKYTDLFPIKLSSLKFDTTVKSPSPLTGQATFTYTSYSIVDKNGKPLWT